MSDKETQETSSENEFGKKLCNYNYSSSAFIKKLENKLFSKCQKTLSDQEKERLTQPLKDKKKSIDVDWTDCTMAETISRVHPIQQTKINLQNGPTSGFTTHWEYSPEETEGHMEY